MYENQRLCSRTRTPPQTRRPANPRRIRRCRRGALPRCSPADRAPVVGRRSRRPQARPQQQTPSRPASQAQLRSRTGGLVLAVCQANLLRLRHRSVDGAPHRPPDRAKAGGPLSPALRQCLADRTRCQPPEAPASGPRARSRSDRALVGPGLGADKKKAHDELAHVVLIDEAGCLLAPLLRRSQAPRGHTPLCEQPGGRRDKVSAIAALSPVRQQLGLYFQTFPYGYVTAPAAADFLEELLRHLRGKVIVVWDRGPIHRGPALRRLLERDRKSVV